MKNGPDSANMAADIPDDFMAELATKLKTCDPYIKQYIAELTAENLKLQKQLIKCIANKVTLENRIKVLQEEQNRPQVDIVMNFGEPTSDK